MNEKTTLTTFLNSRGSRNIDLTVINIQLLRAVDVRGRRKLHRP